MRDFSTLEIIKERRKKTTKDRNGNDFSTIAILPFFNPITFKIEKILKKHNINTTFSNRGMLKNIFSKGKKKKKTNEEKSGIYEISCLDCETKYIGQTRRKLCTRNKEHEAAVKFKQHYKSSVAKHCIDENHRKGEIKLLKEIQEPHKLDIYESIYIDDRTKKGRSLMNEADAPVTSKLFSFANLEN